MLADLPLWFAAVSLGVTAVVGGASAIATLMITNSQKEKDREHQNTLSQKDRQHQEALRRNEFMRNERIAAYRRLMAVAWDMLRDVEQQIVFHWEGITFDSKAEDEWNSALAEVRLVGALPVLQAAWPIDAVASGKITQLALLNVMANRADPDPVHVGSIASITVAQRDQRMRGFTQRLEGYRPIVAALQEACRDDIATL